MGAIFYENEKLIKTKLNTWNKYSILYKWTKYSRNSTTNFVITTSESYTTFGPIVSDKIYIGISGDAYNIIKDITKNTYVLNYAIRYVTLDNMSAKSGHTFTLSNVITVKTGSIDLYNYTYSDNGFYGYLDAVTIPANALILPYNVTSGSFDASSSSYNYPEYDHDSDEYGYKKYENDLCATTKSISVKAGIYYFAANLHHASDDSSMTGSGYVYLKIKYDGAKLNACSNGTTYSRGYTNYGTVTDSSRNKYPDNNYSGSYWYVYNGTTNGDLIETITAEPGTYPDNGVSGNYYYIKQE